MSRKSRRRKPKPKPKPKPRFKQSERAWCAIYRVLMPYRIGLMGGVGPTLLLWREHIMDSLEENADAIDAIPVDELLAVYAAGGRAALYSRCVAGEPWSRVVSRLALLDREELAAIDRHHELTAALTGFRDEMRRSSQAIDAFIAAFRLRA